MGVLSKFYDERIRRYTCECCGGSFGFEQVKIDSDFDQNFATHDQTGACCIECDAERTADYRDQDISSPHVSDQEFEEMYGAPREEFGGVSMDDHLDSDSDSPSVISSDDGFCACGHGIPCQDCDPDSVVESVTFDGNCPQCGGEILPAWHGTYCPECDDVPRAGPPEDYDPEDDDEDYIPDW